jgi:hypothetical protein
MPPRGAGKHRQQWRQMALVMPPAAKGMAIQRLPHLPVACRQHWPRGAMERQTGGFPVQAEEADEASAFAFQVSNQAFVVHLDHAFRQAAQPVRCQLRDGAAPRLQSARS